MPTKLEQKDEKTATCDYKNNKRYEIIFLEAKPITQKIY